MAKAQVIKCKCEKIFAACTEPGCYTDKDWMKDLKTYVQDGCTISVIGIDAFKFENCICKEDNKENVLMINPNQTTLNLVD